MIEELKSFWENSQKKNFRGGGAGLGGGGGVRVDVNEELKFLCKFKKKFFGGGGVRVDVNQELKFFGKFKKKNWGGGGGGGGWVHGGSGLGGQDGCVRRI